MKKDREMYISFQVHMWVFSCVLPFASCLLPFGLAQVVLSQAGSSAPVLSELACDDDLLEAAHSQSLSEERQQAI